jgi:hypothetical protein
MNSCRASSFALGCLLFLPLLFFIFYFKTESFFGMQDCIPISTAFFHAGEKISSSGSSYLKQMDLFIQKKEKT